jgi:hypothetical protein
VSTKDPDAYEFFAPNEFFSYSCFETDDQGEPVFGSWGVVAMGQVTGTGTRLYDGFMGTYKLKRTRKYVDGSDVARDYEMDFTEDDWSLFSTEPFFNVHNTGVEITSKAVNGIHRAWQRKSTYFRCFVYQGAAAFTPTSFNGMDEMAELAEISFDECLSEAEISGLLG